MTFWRLYILLHLSIGSHYCLQAYDCTKEKTKYTEISLKEIGPCHEVGKNYNNPEPINVQVIKKIRSNNFRSKYCKVKVSIDVIGCGSDGVYSYSYAGKIISTNEVILVTKDECERAHKSRKITVDIGDQNIIAIPFDHANYVTDTMEVKGSLKHDSSCSGTNFKFKGMHYDSSILRLTYEAEIREVNAIYNADDEEVIIPNKVKTPAKFMFVTDIEYGTYTWTDEDITREISCDDYQEVISGKANIYYPVSDKSNYEPIILFEDAKRGRQAALMKSDATGACGRVVHRTQLTDILVLFPNKPGERLMVKEINQLNTDKFMNLEGLISLTHLSSELRTNEAFAKITGTICEANRLRLQESINNFASSGVGLSNKPEGTITIKAGSAAYHFECAPVEVELRLEGRKSCTHEIPIWVDSPEGPIAKFADPVSLVIMSNATLTICASLSPVKWALPHPSGIGYEWVCSTPGINRCNAPSVLDPMLIKNSVFNIKSEALSMSFYDRTDLENLAKFQSMGNVRDAITNKITHDTLSNNLGSSAGFNIMNGIPEEEFEKLKERLTPWIVTSIGNIWEMFGHAMIAYFALNFIFWFVKVLARLRTIARMHGILSPKIFFAFITELFLASVNQENTRCPFARMNLTEVRNLLARPPSYNEEAEQDGSPRHHI